MATKTRGDIDIDITPDVLAAGLQVLVDSGVLDRGAGTELPTGGDEVLVTDIYKAMVRARSGEAAVQVTVPGVIEPGAELVVKNESDHPIRVIADPHETLKLRCAGLSGPDRQAPRSSRRPVVAHSAVQHLPTW
jgi:hypothetical protein